MKTVRAGKISLSNSLSLVYIGGPCVIETCESYLKTAKDLKNMVVKTGASFILKASFDKANRSSVDAFRGPGLEKGLEILAQAKARLKVPVLVDVHEPAQAAPAARVADILQVPAFLSRQTDLILACAKTGKTVNIKKGQFMSPQSIMSAVKKVESVGNRNIMLTERGASFGYGDLVADMRSLEIMKRTGYPVIFDLTHSMQKPGSLGNATGGDKIFAFALARAAVAVGIAGIFFEAHPDPCKALSDAQNSLDYGESKTMLKQTQIIDNAVKKCLKKI
jgi:2-dehydro-3-deoxyphosphooctonate aldolase (KDO 8-P synthase)